LNNGISFVLFYVSLQSEFLKKLLSKGKGNKKGRIIVLAKPN